MTSELYLKIIEDPLFGSDSVRRLRDERETIRLLSFYSFVEKTRSEYGASFEITKEKLIGERHLAKFSSTPDSPVQFLNLVQFVSDLNKYGMEIESLGSENLSSLLGYDELLQNSRQTDIDSMEFPIPLDPEGKWIRPFCILIRSPYATTVEKILLDLKLSKKDEYGQTVKI